MSVSLFMMSSIGKYGTRVIVRLVWQTFKLGKFSTRRKTGDMN